MPTDENVRKLLSIIGDRGKCKSCDAEIWWVKTKKGKKMPVTAKAICHFEDCPNSDSHRKQQDSAPEQDEIPF